MPAIITADLSGQKEVPIAISSSFILSAVDIPTTVDTEGLFFVSFFMKALFIFLALQQSGTKINRIATIYIGPTKPDYGIRYLYAIESCPVITAS